MDAGHELQEALQVRFHGDFMACKWLLNGGMMGIYLGYVCIYIFTYIHIEPCPAKQNYIVDVDQFRWDVMGSLWRLWVSEHGAPTNK